MYLNCQGIAQHKGWNLNFLIFENRRFYHILQKWTLDILLEILDNCFFLRFYDKTIILAIS
jgi:hypothetical protein